MKALCDWSFASMTSLLEKMPHVDSVRKESGGTDTLKTFRVTGSRIYGNKWPSVVKRASALIVVSKSLNGDVLAQVFTESHMSHGAVRLSEHAGTVGAAVFNAHLAALVLSVLNQEMS